jgi:glycosyltransferase involved in cell wall biosynthesis
MHGPLVSIIMPMRNAAPFIEECLLSIVKQTYTNYELLIVDDHSSDESAQLIQGFLSSKSIRLLKNKGKGIIPALQTAYQQSSGEIITRMDADDIMPSQKLEWMVNKLLIHDKGHVVTGLVKYFRQGEIGLGYRRYAHWLNNITRSKSNFQEIYKECVIPSPCWMMFREDFDRIGGFEGETYPEDYDLAFRMYKYGMKVMPVRRVCHLWRDHGSRASRNDPNYADNNFLDIKLNYFLELDYKKEKPLLVWGAGKKGKYVAMSLKKRNVPFKWLSENGNKIGKSIYGIEVYRPIPAEWAEVQIIVLVANENEQMDIRLRIAEADSFYFC